MASRVHPFAFLALSAGFSVPAAAEALVFLATNESGEDLYVDRDSLRTLPADGLRRFPAVQLWAVNQVKAGRRTPARTERYLFSFNCTARTVNVLSYQNNRTGVREQNWRAADLGHRYEAPKAGTMAEVAMAFACSGGKLPVAPAAPTTNDIELEEGSIDVPSKT